MNVVSEPLPPSALSNRVSICHVWLVLSFSPRGQQHGQGNVLVLIVLDVYSAHTPRLLYADVREGRSKTWRRRRRGMRWSSVPGGLHPAASNQPPDSPSSAQMRFSLLAGSMYVYPPAQRTHTHTHTDMYPPSVARLRHDTHIHPKMHTGHLVQETWVSVSGQLRRSRSLLRKYIPLPRTPVWV